MMWILQYMTMHPDVQAKVQQEIDNVVGKWPAWENGIRAPNLHHQTSDILFML